MCVVHNLHHSRNTNDMPKCSIRLSRHLRKNYKVVPNAIKSFVINACWPIIGVSIRASNHINASFAKKRSSRKAIARSTHASIPAKNRINVICVPNSLHLAIVSGFTCVIMPVTNHLNASTVARHFHAQATEVNTLRHTKYINKRSGLHKCRTIQFERSLLNWNAHWSFSVMFLLQKYCIQQGNHSFFEEQWK